MTKEPSNCWTAEISHQTRMRGKNDSIWSPQFPNTQSVNMPHPIIYEVCWLQIQNEDTIWIKDIMKCIRFNIWYIVFVLFSVKYRVSIFCQSSYSVLYRITTFLEIKILFKLILHQQFITLSHSLTVSLCFRGSPMTWWYM